MAASIFFRWFSIASLEISTLPTGSCIWNTIFLKRPGDVSRSLAKFFRLASIDSGEAEETGPSGKSPTIAGRQGTWDLGS
jgi:hypothetical protein